MSEIAYNNAIGRLNRGQYVLCVPGHVDDQPAIFVRSYKLTPTARKYAYHRSDSLRAMFAVRMLKNAADDAKDQGMSVEAL